jgi:hypothetical protein
MLLNIYHKGADGSSNVDKKVQDSESSPLAWVTTGQMASSSDNSNVYPKEKMCYSVHQQREIVSKFICAISIFANIASLSGRNIFTSIATPALS